MAYVKTKKNGIIKRTFSLYQEDVDAMEVIKNHKIIVSDFIRYSLKEFAKELQEQDNGN